MTKAGKLFKVHLKFEHAAAATSKTTFTAVKEYDTEYQSVRTVRLGFEHLRIRPRYTNLPLGKLARVSTTFF